MKRKDGSMEELQPLFDAGDSDGLVQMGTELFRQGKEHDAFECYRLACKLGNAVAMGNLGYCYQNGRGIKSDPRLAVYCFERASELGDPGSMLKLGDFYFHGKYGLNKDQRRSIGYYLKAYEIAVSASEPNERLLAQLCYRIGVCKKDGLGTEQSYQDAYEYFQAAADPPAADADYGDLQAQNLLRKAEAGMTECETYF